MAYLCSIKPLVELMRHRRKGRVLGRSPSHRKALYKNLASSLFLTERDAEFDENAPAVKGRVITTLQKAKEIRPLVERCITIAKRAAPSEEAAEQFATSAERGSAEWKKWRESEQWVKWTAARAPALAARRRVLQMLGDKQAMHIVFNELADRFKDRPGGYTRIVRLAKPRLGDGGTRVILEFVGNNDRSNQKTERPSFADDSDTPSSASQQAVAAKADKAETSDSESADAEKE